MSKGPTKAQALKFAEEFGAICKLGAELAHREHWKTQGPGSQARHDALAEFYGDLNGLTDAFIETFSGDYDATVDVPLADNTWGTDIVKVLEGQRGWINTNRDVLCHQDDRPLQAIIDEVVNRYSRTLYKLRRLK